MAIQTPASSGEGWILLGLYLRSGSLDLGDAPIAAVSKEDESGADGPIVLTSLCRGLLWFKGVDDAGVALDGGIQVDLVDILGLFKISLPMNEFSDLVLVIRA